MGKASRRKRERRLSPTPLGLTLNNLPADVRSRVESGQITVNRNPEGRKISASLVALLDPYLDGAESLPQVEALVGLGALAWNTASSRETEREGLLREAIKKFQGEGVEEFGELLRGLVERKLAMFPDDRRLLVTWEVREDRDEFRILAASAEADYE